MSHFSATECVDDPSVDCSHMNSLFGICKDVSHAKVVCPQFCNLCNVGKIFLQFWMFILCQPKTLCFFVVLIFTRIIGNYYLTQKGT